MTVCDCRCHKVRGVTHTVPCCDQPPLGQEFGTAFKLSWNPSDNPFFDHYEIERNEAGKGWISAILVRDATVTQVHDMEALANTQVSYRVRVVANNGNMGPWNMIQPELVTLGG